jgi:hypothetical protein
VVQENSNKSEAGFETTGSYQEELNFFQSFEENKNYRQHFRIAVFPIAEIYYLPHCQYSFRKKSAYTGRNRYLGIIPLCFKSY